MSRKRKKDAETIKLLADAEALLLGRVVKRNDGVLSREFLSARPAGLDPKDPSTRLTEAQGRTALAALLVIVAQILQDGAVLEKDLGQKVASILKALASHVDPTSVKARLMEEVPLNRTVTFSRTPNFKAHPNPWYDWQIAEEVDDLRRTGTPLLEAYDAVAHRHKLSGGYDGRVARIYRKVTKPQRR
jgi:hypothetical protein